MTEAQFKKWTRNRNFTLSHDRILQVSNDIAEGMAENYTKKEAAEVATYHSLTNIELRNQIEAMKMDETLRKLGELKKQLHAEGQRACPQN